MHFFVDSQVFTILPDYCVGAIVLPAFDNTHQIPEISQLLDEAASNFSTQVQGINLKEDSRIEPYRSAFRSLNINPNKFMCSIEALAKRVQKKAELPHINPLVDLGNAVSLKHFVPIGVHDIDQFDGDSMGVRFSQPGDHFQPMGSTELEQPDENELLYVSGQTVKTRRWTWRQSDDGKITEQTRHALIVIDGFYGNNEASVQAAANELCDLFQRLCHSTPLTGTVDSSHPVFEW